MTETPVGLVVDGIHRSYGRHIALHDVSFQIAPGELACLIGPNGAGKSTLMRILAGHQIPDAGEVHIRGARVACPNADEATLAAARAHVALTPQELDLFDHLTAEETLDTVCRLRGVDASEISDRVQIWIDALLLRGTTLRLVRELSGGQKRKVAIAATLISDPDVAVLDESFTGLDPESVAAVEQRLRSYCAAGGIVLLSSHVLDLVHRLADRIVTLRAGSLREVLSRDQINDLVPSRFQHLGEYYLDRVGETARGDG
jgi:ABC-2 type transport system ATP-binding protein